MSKISKGSAQDMLNAFEDKLQELQGSEVASATNTCGIGTKVEPINSVEDDDDIDIDVTNEYVADILSAVADALRAKIDNIDQTINDGSATLSMTAGGDEIVEFTIPFEDLTHDENQDVQLILDAIEDGLKD